MLSRHQNLSSGSRVETWMDTLMDQPLVGHMDRHILSILWHVNSLPGSGSINTPQYTQQWNTIVMQPASRQQLGKHFRAGAITSHANSV
jgi:hypothetical protein